MAKNKDEKASPSEQDLLKALDELEKGAIPEQMKDANGGLATEGDSSELQESAEENAMTDAKVILKGQDDESSEDEASSSPMDESSPEERPPMAKGKKMAKGSRDTSSPGEDHDTSSPGSPNDVTKSMRDRTEEDDTIQKAIEVSDFMSNLVSITTDSVDSLRKSLDDLNSTQSSFNGRMRKAMVAMGNMMIKQDKLIKSLVEKLGGVPVPRREGRSVLSKSEIQNRRFSDGGEGEESDSIDHNDPRQRAKVCSWLVSKAMKGEIPAVWVTNYESGLGMLPPDIMKACEDDLSKSAS